MRSLKFLLVIATLFLFANMANGQKVRVKPEKEGVRSFSLMTYNIRHGLGMDGKIDIERIAREIEIVNPDVVTLQEVDSKTERSNGSDNAAELAKLLGYYKIFGRAMDYNGGEYGNAILFKEIPMAQSVIELPGKDEPRCMLVVEFSEYIVATCHLSLDSESRIQSCYKINDVISEISSGKFRKDGKKVFSGSDKPIFLTGDFNALPEDSDIFVMSKAFYWLSKSKSFTYPSNRPNKILDYIFLYKNKAGLKLMKEFDKGSKGMASWVQPEEMASDHRPVLLTILWDKEFVVEEISQ